jgi:hypothetical protein
MDGVMSTERIDELEEMLSSRTDFDGKPKHGYAANVAMIKDEIRRLKRLEEYRDDDSA